MKTLKYPPEDSVHQAGAYNRSLIEASLDPLVTIGADGKITDVNAATESATGGLRSELVGTDFSNYFTEPEKAKEGYQRAFREGSVRDYPLELRHRDGHLTSVLYNASVYRDDQGSVAGVFAAARDVTVRKQAETRQRAAAAYVRSLIEASVDPLVTISAEGRITDVNQATELVTGVPRQQLIGTDFSDYFTEPQRAREGYLQVFSHGSVKDYALAIRHVTGRITDVIYNASVYRDENGKTQGVFAAARDVTERKMAEELQRSASAYARSLIEASMDPLVTINAEGKITDVNEALVQATGVPREQLIGTDFSGYFTEPDKAREGYQKAFSLGSVRDYLLELQHADGHLTPVLYNASVYRNESGKVVGVFAAARDLSERRRAEETARQLAAIVESSDDAILSKDFDGMILTWNQGAEQLYGFTAAEAVGQSFMRLVPTERQDELRDLLQRVARGERVEHHQTVRRCKNGRLADVSVTLSPIKNARGQIVGASTIARDITAQRQAQEALRRANAYNRSLIEASLDPLVTIGADGKITDVNVATEKATGRPRAKLIGTDFSDYFTEPEKAKGGYQRVFREGSVRDYPLELRHRDGRTTSVLYNASVYQDESGKASGVFAAARDIGERKRAEEQIRRYAEGLKRSNQDLEHFAYVASHDLQEPLRTIASFSELLARRYRGKLDADADEFLGFITEGAIRMQMLINDLLAYSRVRTRGQPFIPVNCEKVLQMALSNLDSAIAQSGALISHDALPTVSADSTQLTQLFQNLIGNGIKFRQQATTPSINVSAAHQEDAWQFGVHDNGIGIDPQFFERIFVIFQRLHTRDAYPGTGIGLAVCKQIVERHGGRIWVESQPGKGSTFYFTLPDKPRAFD